MKQGSYYKSYLNWLPNKIHYLKHLNAGKGAKLLNLQIKTKIFLTKVFLLVIRTQYDRCERDWDPLWRQYLWHRAVSGGGLLDWTGLRANTNKCIEHKSGSTDSVIFSYSFLWDIHGNLTGFCKGKCVVIL